MADFIGAVDQGTTSTRFIDLRPRRDARSASHQLEHDQILPRAGWVEHNPLEIWERTQTVIGSGADLALAWPRVRPRCDRGDQPARDRPSCGTASTGRPWYNADRLAGHPHRLDRQGAGCRWARRRDPAQGRSAPGHVLLRGQGAVAAGRTSRACAPTAERGDALFGTPDTWVVWNLTGGPDGGHPRHGRHQRQPHDAHGPARPWTGTTSCSASSASPGRCCRRIRQQQ
jgi:glycerol kinase